MPSRDDGSSDHHRERRATRRRRDSPSSSRSSSSRSRSRSADVNRDVVDRARGIVAERYIDDEVRRLLEPEVKRRLEIAVEKRVQELFNSPEVQEQIRLRVDFARDAYESTLLEDIAQQKNAVLEEARRAEEEKVRQQLELKKSNELAEAESRMHRQQQAVDAEMRVMEMAAHAESSSAAVVMAIKQQQNVQQALAQDRDSILNKNKTRARMTMSFNSVKR